MRYVLRESCSTSLSADHAKSCAVPKLLQRERGLTCQVGYQEVCWCHPEVNLRKTICVPWLWNPAQSATQVQNEVVSAPTKVLSSKFFLKRFITFGFQRTDVPDVPLDEIDIERQLAIQNLRTTQEKQPGRPQKHVRSFFNKIHPWRPQNM